MQLVCHIDALPQVSMRDKIVTSLKTMGCAICDKSTADCGAMGCPANYAEITC